MKNTNNMQASDSVEDSLYVDGGVNEPTSPAFSPMVPEANEPTSPAFSPMVPEANEEDCIAMDTSEMIRRAEMKEEVRKDQEQEMELENEVRRRKNQSVKGIPPSGSLQRSARKVSMAKKPGVRKEQEPKEEKPVVSSEFNSAWIFTGVLVIILVCILVLCKKAIDSVLSFRHSYA